MLLASGVPVGAEPPTGPLRVGVAHDFPPYVFVDDAGEPVGFAVDLFRTVAELQGLTYEFVPGTAKQIGDWFEAGELDVIAGIARTPERERAADFTIPIITVGHFLFVREGSSIETLADLENQMVAVARRTAWDEVMRQEIPGVVRRRVETVLDGLRLLDQGTVPGAVALMDQGLYLKRKHGLSEIRSVGDPLGQLVYRFAVTEGSEELLAQLNDGLLVVRRDGSYDALWDEWLGVLKPRGPWGTGWGRLLLGGLAALALLLVMSALWSGSLRRRVELRTRELRASEGERQRLQAHLLQSQKMEALGRLAAGIAHDFNNLLTVILGGVSVVRDDPRVPADLDDMLAGAIRAGSTGAELTKQLLGFARRQAVEPSPVDWNGVVSDGEDMLRRFSGSQTVLVVERASQLERVLLDPGQALQILMNLVINARDAGARTIRIEPGRAERESRTFVRLSVYDDGEGMAPEMREHIFEPFFTSKGVGRGTGLGLATAQGIVEQNGGRIEVESEPGRGSVFHVLLPPASDEPDEESEPVVEIPDRSILVVDADADVLALAAELLGSLGYEVAVAGDAEEALGLLQEKGRTGTLLTDVELPGISGPELARQVLDEWPGVRVLFTAGYPGTLRLPRGVRVAFVTKPFSRESLAGALGERSTDP